MTEIAVVAISVAKPGAEAQLQAALEALVEPTRSEPGALQYELHRDLRDPRCFVFVERWESEAALAAHGQSPHIQAYRSVSGEWVERFELRVLSKIA